MLPVSCCWGRAGPWQSCASATRALLPVQGPAAGQVCWMLAVPHTILSRQVHLSQLCCAFCPCLILMVWGPSSLSWPVLSDTWHWTQLPQAPTAGGWVQTCHILSRSIVLWLVFPSADPVTVELAPA